MKRFQLDPLGFAKYAYPWGEPGTPLAKYDGPMEWQARFLDRLGAQLRARDFDGKTPVAPVLMAVASGHGIGKSALVAMIVNFILSTRPYAKGVITANTGEQLRGKTFAEIDKWTSMCITSSWFESSLGNLWLRHRTHKATWRVDGLTWRENKTEAFAGLHAAGSTPFYVFDEGSGIPDGIYDVSLGGLTDGEPIQLVFGNPTRNTGRFFEMFGRLRHRWDVQQIDSRDSELANKALIQEWVEDYGEDSDFVRVRVKGQFPRAGTRQFIPSDFIAQGRKNEAVALIDDALVLGVDAARFGSAESVIAVRKGRDARGLPWRHFRGLDGMQLAARVAETIEELRALNLHVDACFVDSVGIGGPVADRIRQLGYDAVDVIAGSTDCRPPFKRKDAECWGAVREWLKVGGSIPDDDVLASQLAGREYGYDAMNRLYLEPKEHMEERGLESPDRADALALTFAFPVSRINLEAARRSAGGKKTWDYDPYQEGRL
jgi:hypothetical protein